MVEGSGSQCGAVGSYYKIIFFLLMIGASGFSRMLCKPTPPPPTTLWRFRPSLSEAGRVAHSLPAAEASMQVAGMHDVHTRSRALEQVS